MLDSAAATGGFRTAKSKTPTSLERCLERCRAHTPPESHIQSHLPKKIYRNPFSEDPAIALQLHLCLADVRVTDGGGGMDGRGTAERFLSCHHTFLHGKRYKPNSPPQSFIHNLHTQSHPPCRPQQFSSTLPPTSLLLLSLPHHHEPSSSVPHQSPRPLTSSNPPSPLSPATAQMSKCLTASSSTSSPSPKKPTIRFSCSPPHLPPVHQI